MTEWQKKGYDTVECNKCYDYYYRKAIGISPNRRRKYYQDEKGRAWKGKTCPTCSTKAHTQYMKKYRERLKEKGDRI